MNNNEDVLRRRFPALVEGVATLYAAGVITLHDVEEWDEGGVVAHARARLEIADILAALTSPWYSTADRRQDEDMADALVLWLEGKMSCSECVGCLEKAAADYRHDGRYMAICYAEGNQDSPDWGEVAVDILGDALRVSLTATCGRRAIFQIERDCRWKATVQFNQPSRRSATFIVEGLECLKGCPSLEAD